MRWKEDERGIRKMLDPCNDSVLFLPFPATTSLCGTALFHFPYAAMCIVLAMTYYFAL